MFDIIGVNMRQSLEGSFRTDVQLDFGMAVSQVVPEMAASHVLSPSLSPKDPKATEIQEMKPGALQGLAELVIKPERWTRATSGRWNRASLGGKTSQNDYG